MTPQSLPVFRGASANDVWVQAASAVMDGGLAEQPSRGGATREILHAVFQIEEPQQRWIPSRRPAANPAFAIAEALWILWGRNDGDLPVFFNPKFPQFSGAGPLHMGAYGYRLRRAFGLDQLERSADALAVDPSSRQVVLQIWSAPDDLPRSDGSSQRDDIPCNVVSMLKVRDGRLHWTQVMRSNDLVLGLPHNIVQFTTMQEVVAGWLGVGLGPYTHLSDSLHVYHRDLQNVESVSPVVPVKNVDSLALPREDSRAVLRDLEERFNNMINARLSPRLLDRLAAIEGLPSAYGNLVLVAAADTAQRRGWHDLTEHYRAACSNPALSQMLTAWLERKSLRTRPDAHT